MDALIKDFTTEYELYLQDESRKKGYAQTISFPKNIEEAACIVKHCNEKDTVVTVRSSGTGVGGGAVPFGGHLMSLERLKDLRMSDDGKGVIAGAGCSLNDINRFVNIKTGGEMFLPPDPTEGTAGVGGIVSCNASGARTYMYGPVRGYVKRLKVIMAEGQILDIERGKIFATGRTFKINGENFPGGTGISGILPGYVMTKIKNAAGYYVHDDMDMIDIFIGAEGTLGIIAEAELELVKKPKFIWGLIAFFKDENCGIKFAELIKNSNHIKRNIMSIEFFDQGSLDILRNRAEDQALAGSFHRIEKCHREAVFTEICGDSKEEQLCAVESLENMIKLVRGDPDEAWCAISGRSFEAFKELRHATPEGVNKRIAEIKKVCPSITKLGSDMSVPDELLSDTVRMYKRDLEKAGLKYAMFGHIGNSHLHVNVISRNEKEYLKGREIFATWAEHIGRAGGSVSAEHGVGKLKREFLLKMYGEKAVYEMRDLKRCFDPKGILNRDNIFLWDITNNKG